MTADLLRRAADRIDELAEQAPPGPWRNVQDSWCLRSEPSPGKATWRSVADEPNPFAIGWMTTLSPQIAGPLTAWLRAAAVELDEDELYANKRNDRERAAIAFACAILGEDQ